MANLSPGAIAAIAKGQTLSGVLVQLLEVRQIQSQAPGAASSERYR